MGRVDNGWHLAETSRKRQGRHKDRYLMDRKQFGTILARFVLQSYCLQWFNKEEEVTSQKQ